jgi:soluble lytic murein transglycosylase-like protein
MGEVYRATDVDLKRVVAIKVLPQSVATEPASLARFRREAEILAALNHPNIAQIHGLERAGGQLALVMELVEGPTLAERIARRAIPVDETLRIARQIADALDAAHAKGIVHRDLKPANIKVAPDGVVKVLDFGLAKTVPSDRAVSEPSQAPTSTEALTRAGVLLGTVAYMSPEHVRGQAVDRRTDIWGFGCVLYEMLTGRNPFQRETTPDTIVAVLEGEVEWTALPAATPPAVRRLLQRCLAKDPKRRLRDIGDARHELAAEAPHSADGASVPSTAGRSTLLAPRHDTFDIRRGRRAWAALALAVLVAGTVLAWFVRARESTRTQELRRAAEEVFYDLRALEVNLVRLRQLDRLSNDVREATYRRDKLSQAYDSYVEGLGFYKDKSETERAILRLARRLGEADVDAPPDFYRATLAYAQKWTASPRLVRGIARARERNLIRRITSVLDDRGLPRELLFMVLQESGFASSAVGPVTSTGISKGLWQLTPDAARRYGLTLGPHVTRQEFDPADERHDEVRSTEAAANYLADLYSSKAAASTLLVMAAYNLGEGRVLRRLEDLPNDPRERNFWNFYRNHWLPDETRDYVMSVFSAAVVCEHPEMFNVPLERVW